MKNKSALARGEGKGRWSPKRKALWEVLVARRRLALGMMGQSGTPCWRWWWCLQQATGCGGGVGRGLCLLASGGRRQGKTQVSVACRALGSRGRVGGGWGGVGWGICSSAWQGEGAGYLWRVGVATQAAHLYSLLMLTVPGFAGALHAHDGSRLVAQPVADSLGCASRQAQANAATAVGLGNEAGLVPNILNVVFPSPAAHQFWLREGGDVFGGCARWRDQDGDVQSGLMAGGVLCMHSHPMLVAN